MRSENENCRMKPILLTGACFVAALLGADTAQAGSPRAPLRDAKGVAPEGRNILLDCDSYPPPGRLISGPTLRRLGCGVLGPNAIEPFRPNALEQEIIWDGKDARGLPAPPACKVVVSVGLTPRLERFIGYDPGQLLDRIIWLETDPQGRRYWRRWGARSNKCGRTHRSMMGKASRTGPAVGRRLCRIAPIRCPRSRCGLPTMAPSGSPKSPPVIRRGPAAVNRSACSQPTPSGSDSWKRCR